jgi:hypothetical protein
MVKAIVPRYRYDQLMRIGWKVFLPMSLAWVVLVAFLAKFEILGHFWARYAPGRLYDVPVAMGWAASPTPEDALNPTWMFL